MKKLIRSIVGIVTAFGAINWGLVGAFNTNLVTTLFGTMPGAVNIVYIIIGICGVLCTAMEFSNNKY